MNFAQKKSLRNCGGEESRRSLLMDEVRTDGQGTFLNNKLDCWAFKNAWLMSVDKNKCPSLRESKIMWQKLLRLDSSPLQFLNGLNSTVWLGLNIWGISLQEVWVQNFHWFWKYSYLSIWLLILGFFPKATFLFDGLLLLIWKSLFEGCPYLIL